MDNNHIYTISRCDYTYSPEGSIATWQRQFGSAAATQFTLGYDLANQLTSANLAPVANLTAITQRYSYQYDPAGNRTSQQVGNTVANASHNNANQITSTAGGGKLLVAGTTNEPAKVTVNGKTATVTPPPQNLYQAWIDVTPGANTITIAATDYAPTPNTTTKSWSVNVTGGPARTFTYDTDGNTLTDGLRSYQWDAEDRLVKITQGANVYEFTYDSSSRRVSEKVNGTLTRRWLWDGPQISEERDAVGTTITKRYYAQGEQRIGGTSAGNYYYTRDHLGSIREMTDSTAALRVRYDYDPYGKRTKLSGDLDCDFGFTGHYYHSATGLHLALYRAYDADLGRWLSADPIREEGGTNLYEYVGNCPISNFDLLGLVSKTHYHGGGGDWRLDGEVNGPGKAGGVHINFGSQKWQFDPKSQTWINEASPSARLPKSIRCEMNSKAFKSSMKNAVNRVNQEGGGFSRLGGAIGKYLPAVAAIGIVIGLNESANSMQQFVDAMHQGNYSVAENAAMQVAVDLPDITGTMQQTDLLLRLQAAIEEAKSGGCEE